MNAPTLREQVLDCLVSIAPEVDLATIEPDKPLRNQVDLDSFDWLRFLVALHEVVGVEIPESDYPMLGTLDAVTSYLAARQR